MTGAWRSIVCTAVTVLGGLAAAAPAEAAFKLCNRTSFVLYAAVGYPTGDEVVTQGWTRLLPGACETALGEALQSRVYYVYARTSDAHSGRSRAWGGDTRLCGKATDFVLSSKADLTLCQADDAFMFPFAAVATKGRPNWTMTFTESSEIKDLETARTAGLQRLLNDNGYKVGAIDGMPGRRTSHAEAKFRASAKLPAGADDTAVLDALETAAQRIASPAGYSICNETNEPIWAAIALEEAAGWVSRGWWKVAPRACAKVTTTALKTGKVYLLAERRSGTRIVSGSERFCITDVQFDHAGRGDCAEHGLSEAGFASTDTAGAEGYAAHISDDGLVQVASTPK